ncbi:MAG TPA: hypothetical protein VMH81_30185 [Bryobacteraceae bacterium]|nr:hypothetical protein [Bryobacteraceae bacterium]
MPKSKWSAFLSLFLVFFSGAVLGAFAYRLYTVNTTVAFNPGVPPRKAGPDEVLRQRLAEMRDRVKADDQQLEQIKQVYAETRDQYDRIRQKMNEEGHAIDENQVAKIKSILRPDQIPVYDQVRAEHEAARRRRMQQRDQPEHK